MEELTGLAGFDFALLFVLALGCALVVGAWFWRASGARVLGALVVPLATGLVLVTILLVLFWPEVKHALERARPPALAVLAVTLFVAVTVADFLVSRVGPLVRRLFSLAPARRSVDVALAASVAVPATLALAAVVALDTRTSSGYERSRLVLTTTATLLGDYELPGQPVGLAFTSESDGYVSLEEGAIARFSLPSTGDALELVPVAEGLQNPRGIAVVDGTLYVTELGPLPCGGALICKGEDVVGAASLEEGERRILRESRARVAAYEVLPDGRLARRRVVLDDLPVANSEHGVNSVVAGTDGRLYVSIGNLDRLHDATLTAAERSRPNFELLGTVVSIEPDGSDLEVVARGLRNVYELATDTSGQLYGVDNDGEARRSWRREEILAIEAGAHYGYPVDGTFGPHAVRTAPPLWILDAVGSAGLEVLRRDGDRVLVIGSCGDVYSLRVAGDGEPTVETRQPVDHLIRVAGCVSSVQAVDEGRLAMTLHTFTGEPRLLVAEVA